MQTSKIDTYYLWKIIFSNLQLFSINFIIKSADDLLNLKNCSKYGKKHQSANFELSVWHLKHIPIQSSNQNPWILVRGEIMGIINLKNHHFFENYPTLRTHNSTLTNLRCLKIGMERFHGGK